MNHKQAKPKYKRAHTIEERVTLKYPDQESKVIATLSPQNSYQRSPPRKDMQAKQSILKCKDKQKESPEMRRQRKNPPNRKEWKNPMKKSYRKQGQANYQS